MVHDSLKKLIRGFSKPICQRFCKDLPITVCDGMINLQINKGACDFCQIFLRFCMGLSKKKIKCTYIYCIHLLVFRKKKYLTFS